MLLRIAFLFLLVPAALAQPATVSGTLVGADGAPLSVAHAELLRPGAEPTAARVVGADGRFAVASRGEGFVTLRLTGLHHRALDVTLWLDAGASVKVDARLATYAPADSLGDVRAQGGFPGAGRTLKPQPDGTFAETFVARADTVAYRVSGVTADDFPIAGTALDRVALDADGGYTAVLDAPVDSVTITFDPSLLPQSDRLPAVDFADPNSRASRTAAVLQSLDNRSERVYDVRRRILLGTRTTSPEDRQVALDRATAPFRLEEENARLEAALADETDPAVRQALLLNYVSVETDLAEKDAALGLRALEEIGPDNPLWGLHPALVQRALDLAARADSATAVAWMRALLDEHADADARAFALLHGLETADRGGDEGAAEGYYALLEDDAYAETDPGLLAPMMFARYDPDGAVAVGALVPDFSVELLDGGGTVSRQSLLGRTYLIDFWAIWCAPCIAEMPTLHAAYERFRDRGFEILSLSFDDSVEQVRQFRTTEFPMPWLNAYLPEGFSGDIAERFEVRGLPKPVLVGPDGRILALSSGKLRGALLERTLAEHYGVGE
jgi:thiol-disulfide isomerase/thioredoxin